MPSSFRSPARGLLLASAVAFLPAAAACSSDEDGGGGALAAPEIHYELQSFARELSTDTLAALADSGPHDGALRFHGAPPQLDGLKPGDVLVGGTSMTAPKGILRMVVEVKTDGGDTVIATKPAPVQLAFKSLHAKIPVAPAALDGTPTTHVLSQHSKTVGVSGGKSLDWAVFDQDKNPDTKDDQLYVHADVTGSVGLTATIDLDWLDEIDKAAEEAACALAYPVCIPDLPDVGMSVKAEAKADVAYDVEGAAAKSYDSGEIPLDGASFELPPITVGPVVLYPTIDFVMRVSGSAASRFHAKAGVHFSGSTGAGVSLKKGGSFDPPAIEKTIDPPTVEATLTSDVKVSVGPRLSVLFWDSFGPTISLTPYGKLHANSEASPCWGIDVGADLGVTVRLRIPWDLFDLQALGDLLGLSGDLFAVPFGPFNVFESPNLLTGACSPLPTNVYPPGEGPTDDAYKNASFAPWSNRYVWDTHFSFSGEIAEADLHTDKTIDGGWIVSGKGLPGPMKLAESGAVAWVKHVHLPAVEDEEVAFDDAKSAFPLSAADTNVWLATSRFTIMKLDQDGDLVWAKRYRPDDADLPFAIEPTGLVATPDGGALAVYSVQDTPKDGPAVLLRVDAKGKLLWSKTFKFSTAKSFVPVLVADGEEAMLSGFSWEPGVNVAHVMRLKADGTLAFAKTMAVCGNERVKPSGGFRMASGALALTGVYSAAPDRAFLAQVRPDGASASLATWWSGDGLTDVHSNTAVELPVTGFLTLAASVPSVGESLLLASHDATGDVTFEKQMTMKDGSATWSVRPGAVRMTNDGGALLFASISDSSIDDEGLWITKVPARTGVAAFDAALVEQKDGAHVADTCQVELADETIAVDALPMRTVDVTSSIVLDAITPEVTKLVP